MDGQEALALKKKLLAYEKRKVTQILEGRKVDIVAKTFHKAGIVVPYDRKTDIGYRPLSESESKLSGKLSLYIYTFLLTTLIYLETLQKILKCYRDSSESKKIETMDKLQPIINYANIACDECDFGTGLELGIDIFCDGNPDLHRVCKQLLVTVYNLLRRTQFATIIKVILFNNISRNRL